MSKSWVTSLREEEAASCTRTLNNQTEWFIMPTEPPGLPVNIKMVYSIVLSTAKARKWIATSGQPRHSTTSPTLSYYKNHSPLFQLVLLSSCFTNQTIKAPRGSSHMNERPPMRMWKHEGCFQCEMLHKLHLDMKSLHWNLWNLSNWRLLYPKL